MRPSQAPYQPPTAEVSNRPGASALIGTRWAFFGLALWLESLVWILFAALETLVFRLAAPTTQDLVLAGVIAAAGFSGAVAGYRWSARRRAGWWWLVLPILLHAAFVSSLGAALWTELRK